MKDEDVFYSWQCFSLIRKDGTTFDIVVKDMHELMCLLHVMHRLIYGVDEEEEDALVR